MPCNSATVPAAVIPDLEIGLSGFCVLTTARQLADGKVSKVGISQKTCQ